MNWIIFYYALHLDQGIQEETNKNLWKIAFKNFEMIWSA